MTNEQKFHIVYQSLLRGKRVYYLGKQVDDVRVNGLFLEVHTRFGWRACNVAPQFSPGGRCPLWYRCPLWQVVESEPEHKTAPLPMRDDADVSVKYGEKFALVYSASFVDQKFPAGTIISCAGFEIDRDEISGKECCFPVYLFPDGTYRQEMRSDLQHIPSAPIFFKADSCGVF